MIEAVNSEAPSGEDSHRTKGLVRLTMACNERCPFCNVPAEDYRPATPPMEDIDAEIDGFIAAGARTLTISGGEPTLLRKRLLELTRRARAGGMDFVEVQTNAVLIDEDYAAELAQAGVTSAFVSLLSHVPALHDALTAVEGAFERCIRGIDAMLDVGIRVTLNPVSAASTQHLAADYIDFVAARLPRVRFVSMSAVQPHGRGAHNLDLLPDYAVLGPAIERARQRAAAHGIELVNPYCGLPLCVGWKDDPARSVEAFEAMRGGWQNTPGLDNTGDKSHGAPCQSCAWRTRCGGAWHAYWSLRNGSGIAAPATLVEPWSGVGEDQVVVRAQQGVNAAALGALGEAIAPTVWLWTPQLHPNDVDALMSSGATDVAVELADLRPDVLRPTLAALRRIAGLSQHTQAQRQVRPWLGLRVHSATSPRAVLQVVRLADACGVSRIRLLGAGPRWQRLASALSAEFPHLWIACREPRPPLPGRS